MSPSASAGAPPWSAPAPTPSSRWLAATLLARWPGFDSRLERPRDLTALLLSAALASLTGALIGTTGLWLVGITHPPTFSAFVMRLSTWWLGDAMGVLVMAPPLLIWGRTRLSWPAPPESGDAQQPEMPAARGGDSVVRGARRVLVSVVRADAVAVGAFGDRIPAVPADHLGVDAVRRARRLRGLARADRGRRVALLDFTARTASARRGRAICSCCRRRSR